MEKEKKYFTVAEANRMLPQLRKHLDGLHSLRRQFEKKYRELKAQRTRIGGGADGEDFYFTLEAELEFVNIQARAMIDGMNRTGVQIKEIKGGRVLFPALRQGEEVLLCWTADEEEVRYWYYPWEAFCDRKEVDGAFERDTP
ncbi:MAG: DUF2203 domain-containing protein [Firmicutes bacterium]|nr:DUF2203 domain-containing protein [Bacillota bacterium]